MCLITRNHRIDEEPPSSMEKLTPFPASCVSAGETGKFVIICKFAQRMELCHFPATILKVTGESGISPWIELAIIQWTVQNREQGLVQIC